jgi:hypothetical protein
MFAKHDPALRPIIPFGDDPYDAVGSFAVIGGALLAAISLLRAFRPRPAGVSAKAKLYLQRSEAAVVLTVYAMVASDGIAMARHPSGWLNAPARNELLLVLAGLTALATGTLLLIRRSCERAPAATRPAWTKALMVTAASTLTLWIYPERLIFSFVPHLLTIVAANVILFAPIGFLLPSMFPSGDVAHPSDRHPNARLRWGAILVVGIGVGLFVLAAEIGEGGLPAGRRLLVAAVYVGLSIAGVAVAYAFVGKPIGLRS